MTAASMAWSASAVATPAARKRAAAQRAPRAARACARGSGGGSGGGAPPACAVVFAAGGTGGHVYPAIAVADELVRRDMGVRPLFVGTAGRLESNAAPRAGYDFSALPAVALPRGRSVGTLLALAALPLRLAYAVARALVLLLGVRPACVVGTGGYVCLPACLAAWVLRVPLVVLESNARAGAANRLLSRFAAVVGVAFEGATQSLAANARCELVGNPTRAALVPAVTREARADARARLLQPAGPALSASGEPHVLLVLGGSQGAGAINDAVEAALPMLLEEDQSLHIVWQCGAMYEEALRSRVQPERFHGRVLLTPFVHDMQSAYSAADVVVARAGAITCSELAATASAAVLVPSPNVTDDHQTANARAMAQRGAAVLLREGELGGAKRGDGLAREVSRLLSDQGARRRLREAAGRMGADAASASEKVADIVIELAGASCGGTATATMASSL